MPVVEGIAVGLITAGLSRLSSQIVVGARRLRGKDRKLELEAGQILKGLEFDQTPLRALIDLGSDVTPAYVRSLINAPGGDAIAFECLSEALTIDSYDGSPGLRDRWVSYTAESRLNSDTAASVFSVMVAQANSAVTVLRDNYPQTYDRLRDEACYLRVASVVENSARPNVLTGLPATETLDSICDKYLSRAKSAHQYLTPPDFDKRRFVPIKDLYVAPSIVASHEEAHTKGEVSNLLREIDRTVLLGDPGNGKSTASQVLVHDLASTRGDLIPFLVVLRDYAAERPLISIVEWIARRCQTYYNCQLTNEVIDYLLRSGRALVIFDGLDELLVTSARREITEIVSTFGNAYPTCRVLVTSRRVGYQQAPMDPNQYRVLELAGFDDDQVADYVTRWFKQDEMLEGDPQKWADSFMTESSVVPDLRANPLLLALMCILYRGERSIPKNRPAVYEQCAELLFKKWDGHRSINIELQAAGVVDAAMKHLAYWMLTRHDSGDGVTESDLIRETTAYLHGRTAEAIEVAESAAKEFVEYCRGRAWVFTDVGTTSSGEPLYTFTHRTFMEYFAAFHLVRSVDTPEELGRVLIPRIVAEEWDVVGQLAVQIVDKRIDSGADRVFNFILNEKRRRTPLNRSRLLAFLARCATFAQVTPATLRRLTALLIENLEMLTDNSRALAPIGALVGTLTAQVRDSVIGKEFEEQARRRLDSGNPDEQLFALRLLTVAPVSVHFGLSPGHATAHANDSYNAWAEFAEGMMADYISLIREVARDDHYVRQFALLKGWLGIEEFIAPDMLLRTLLTTTHSRIGSVGWVGPGWHMVNAAVSLRVTDRSVGLANLADLGALIKDDALVFDLGDDRLDLSVSTYTGIADVRITQHQLLALGVLVLADSFDADRRSRSGDKRLELLPWLQSWSTSKTGLTTEGSLAAFVEAWRADVFTRVISTARDLEGNLASDQS